MTVEDTALHKPPATLPQNNLNVHRHLHGDFAALGVERETSLFFLRSRVRLPPSGVYFQHKNAGADVAFFAVGEDGFYRRAVDSFGFELVLDGAVVVTRCCMRLHSFVLLSVGRERWGEEHRTIYAGIRIFNSYIRRLRLFFQGNVVQI